MQHAPRRNHRWQRALAWICLLLAAATAVPIGVSLVAGAEGVILASPPKIWVRGPTLGLTDGALTRAYLKPVSLVAFEVGPPDTLANAAARKFGPASAWRVRWDASDTDLWFEVPVWWVPLVLSAAGLWLKHRVGGLFSRRLRAQNTIVAASFLFAVNAAAAVTPFPIVGSEWPVPMLDIDVGVSTGLCHVQSSMFVIDGREWEQFRTWGVFWGRMRFPDGAHGWLFAIATWWLNIAFGGALLWIGIRAYRRGRDPNACPACGYSLVGLRGSACPECGVPRKEATTALPIAREA